MNALKDFPQDDLFAKIALEDEQFEQWFKDLGLLFSNRMFDTCGLEMRVYGNDTLLRVFTYNRRQCRMNNTKPKVGFYVGTVF